MRSLSLALDPEPLCGTSNWLYLMALMAVQILNVRSPSKEPWRFWKSENYDSKRVGEIVIALLRMNVKRKLFSQTGSEDIGLICHPEVFSSLPYSYLCRVQELSSSKHNTKLIISTPLPAPFFQDKRVKKQRVRKT